jgi:hypothetical protein
MMQFKIKYHWGRSVHLDGQANERDCRNHDYDKSADSVMQFPVFDFFD